MKRKVVIMFVAMSLGLVGCGGNQDVGANNAEELIQMDTQIVDETTSEIAENNEILEETDVLNNDAEIGLVQERESTEPTETEAVEYDLDFASTNYADLDNMQFALNGKLYTLGRFTIKDMIDDGVQFEEDYTVNLENNVRDGERCTFKLKLNKEGTYAYVEVHNYTGENAKVKDLPICMIHWYAIEGNLPDDLAFNFPYTLSEDDLKVNAGEPTILNQDDNGENTYIYDRYFEKYYRHYGYIFTFTNGTLDDVTIEWAPQS